MRPPDSRRITTVMMVIAAALGAAQASGQEACGYWRNEGLVMKVQSKLQFSPLWNKVGNVAVTAKDCVVTLSGTVATREDIKEAERIAASADGVRSVRNELRVASQ